VAEGFVQCRKGDAPESAALEVRAEQ